MKYLIDGALVDERKFHDELEEAVREEIAQIGIDELIDSCYPEYEIGNLKFAASTILANCDPVAYEMYLEDEIDSRLSDCLYDFKSAYKDIINCIHFETIEEDAYEEDEKEL